MCLPAPRQAPLIYDECRMRRGLSIFVALLLALSPLASLLPASDDMSLPVCCRRHGMHHCAMAAMWTQMMARMTSGSTPVASAPSTCPYYPSPANALLSHPQADLTHPAQPPASPTQFLGLLSDRAATRPGQIGSHAGRGPPPSIQS